MEGNISEEGVLVGCNEAQEWLLPWWWSHFREKNPLCEVAFADFGMSPQARQWCEEKGAVIAIPEPSIDTPDVLDKETAAHWEHQWREAGETRDLWPLRKTWYKKPMALSLSPFHRTLWLDLDCEVRGSIEPLFSLPLSAAKFAAISVETNRFPDGGSPYPHYNTGVVLFEKGSPLVNLWNREIREGSRMTCTEEDLLAFLIAHFEIPVTPLPRDWNWEILRFGANGDAIIYHWMGENGKASIRKSLTSGGGLRR